MSPEGSRCTARTRLGEDSPANRGRLCKDSWSQRAGGLPSPVSCRGHRCRVGGGYWRYKDWEMADASGGPGSLQSQALPMTPEVLGTFS